MSGYQQDRKWSDQFIPAIKRIVGPALLTESPLDVDRTEAADLIMFRGRDMTIAARVRRPGYAERYKYEFTIRSERDNGARTELAKMLAGWADWMFYGHAGDKHGEMARWWLIDLDVLREELLKKGYREQWASLCTQQNNRDGTHFIAFDVRKFEASLVIAASHPLSPNERQAA